jgi:glycosyltransferase involved in cell wall biosynthesis
VGQEVILHGWATNDEVRRMIAASRALLLPSYAEGLPIVIMEALALGRPAISTTIAGIPELVDSQCGWLVSPGNHDELVEAMRAALSASPDEIARLGGEGRARVERLHDRRRLARELRDLFAKAGSAKDVG